MIMVGMCTVVSLVIYYYKIYVVELTILKIKLKVVEKLSEETECCHVTATSCGQPKR